MKIRKFLAGFLSAVMIASVCTIGVNAATNGPTQEERCAAAIENYVETKFETNAKDPNSNLWKTFEDAVDLYSKEKKTTTIGKYTIKVDGSGTITLQKTDVNQTLPLQSSDVVAAAKKYADFLAGKTFPSDDLRDTVKTYLGTTKGQALCTHLLDSAHTFQDADIADVLGDTEFRDELCDAVWSIVFSKAKLGDVLKSLTLADANNVTAFLKGIGKPRSDDTKLSEIFENKQNFKDLYDKVIKNDIFTDYFDSKAVNALTNIQRDIQEALNIAPGKEKTSEQLVNEIEQYLDIVPEKAGQFVVAVNNLPETQKETFAHTTACGTLEEAIRKIAPPSIPAPVPDTSLGKNDQMPPIAPTATNLCVAAGVSSAAEAATLTTKQNSPAQGELLSFDMTLKAHLSDAWHNKLNVPVTITFTFPSSFVYDSSKNYHIIHIIHTKTDNRPEPLNLVIGRKNGAYTGTFTTWSFSNFAVTATAKSTGGSTGGSVVTPTEPTNPTSPITYVSDTNANLSVNGAYTFKITSKNGKIPQFVVGTPGIFNTQFVKNISNDYYYKITAIGKPGAKAGIYINGGSRLLIATVKANAYYSSDTTYDLTVNKAYLFKISSRNGKVPTFVIGTPGIFSAKLMKKTGNDYFFKITAIGKSGSKAGVYVDGCPRLLVATVK